MKYVICLGVAIFMVACAPVPTLAELEAEALRTGDWSAVEKREMIIAKREARRPRQCPSGHVNYCKQNIGRVDCVCVSNSAMSSLFARH